MKKLTLIMAILAMVSSVQASVIYGICPPSTPQSRQVAPPTFTAAQVAKDAQQAAKDAQQDAKTKQQVEFDAYLKEREKALAAYEVEFKERVARLLKRECQLEADRLEFELKKTACNDLERACREREARCTQREDACKKVELSIIERSRALDAREKAVAAREAAPCSCICHRTCGHPDDAAPTPQDDKDKHLNHSGGSDGTNPGGHGNDAGFLNPNNVPVL